MTAIEKAVVAVDRGAVLSFDLEAHTVDVTSRLNETELAAILDKEGYPNTLAD
jgi:copper chaperone